MEEKRDDLSVIAAGYKNEMDSFIHSNPGLKSRFNRYIHFPDYNQQELFEIFKLMVKNAQYKLDAGAEQEVQMVIAEMYFNKSKHFGNAREIRNLLEIVIKNHSNRIGQEKNLDKVRLTTISQFDIPRTV